MLVRCTLVSLGLSSLPGRVDDVSSVKYVVDLLVVGAVSGLTVYKRPDIYQ